LSIALAYNRIITETDELHQLIKGCTLNERGAQAKLYHLFYPKMMSMVKRYFPDTMVAEEILNNGFLRAFQKINTYAFRGSFEGWLRKIIFHSVADYASSNIKYKNHILLQDKEEYIHKDHGSRLYYDDLMEIIQKLPESVRTVFNMFVIEGLSHKEISKLIHISEGTSKWHLSEARRILKKEIESLNLHLKK
jgi:RNA polymerase sigma factor (sigma-70 family)